MKKMILTATSALALLALSSCGPDVSEHTPASEQQVAQIEQVEEASLAAVEGKPYVIFFGFAECPDVCPTMLARLVRLREDIGEQFEIVFVTLDPERDTPEVLTEYVNAFDTDIIALLPDQDLLDKFHVYYRKVPIGNDDYVIDHTSAAYLVGADGKFKSILRFDDSDADAEIKLLKLVRP